MSVKMSGLVWDVPLPRDEKFLLLAYADHASHDGTNIFPSKLTVEKMTGYSRRSVQTITAKLVADGWLIQEGVSKHTTIRYRLDLEKLRASTLEGGANSAPAQILRGAKNDNGGAQKTTQRGANSAPNPLVPVNSNPPMGRAGKDLPTSPEAIAIAELFNRKLTTPWSPKEIKAFKDGMRRKVITLEAIALLVPYYASERAKGGNGIHRRDLLTFLNNFDGEVDRAVAFKANPNAHAKRTEPNNRPSARNIGHNANVSYADRPKKGTRPNPAGDAGQLL